MGQNAPHYKLEKLPPLREKVETIEILRQTNKSTAALAELKGIARTIPNQGMLINAVVLQEAKDSSEIENIITTQDELYKALTVNKSHISPATKEVVDYRKAIESTSKDTIARITNIKDQLDSTIVEVQEKAPKLYRKELVELLFEQPYSKIEFVVNKLGVERKAASRYLKELEDIGIVESQKVGRETLYINKKLIEILKQ